jgi:VanZ family protein
VSASTRRALLRSLAPLALMGLIFYLSSQPADLHQPWWEPIARKLGHIGGYGALTLAWIWALRGVVSNPIAVAAAISLAYACTDEYHQSFVETRHGAPVDVLIDSIGIALAALAVRRARLNGRLARA